MVPNPYILLAIVAAWIASLAGVGIWQNHAGATAERVAWQAKEGKELIAANALIVVLETQARAAERAHATAISTISTTYQGKLTHAETQRKADVAAARSGAIRLFDPGASAQSACASGGGEAVTRAGGRDGGEGAGLSPDAAEFLLSEANRADAIVEQLTSCQAVVRADRGP